MMEKSFTIMAQRDIDSRHWEHCLSHVFKVNNMLPHSAFGDQETPYERWFEKRPDGRYLQIFGSDVRVNNPIDANPLPRKYIDPPGHFAVYIGFNYDSVSTHSVWDYTKFQTRGDPIEHVGNDQCKFFRALDPSLYLKSRNDPAYTMYLPDVEPLGDVGSKPTRPSVLKGIRVAKLFRKKLYFGTATKNRGGKFCYDVNYDDGDFEHFNVSEFNLRWNRDVH